MSKTFDCCIFFFSFSLNSEAVHLCLFTGYMSHLGGVASGKLQTLASRCELKDGELVIPPTLKPEIARAANALGKPVTHVEKSLKNIKVGNAKRAVSLRTGCITQVGPEKWVSSLCESSLPKQHLFVKPLTPFLHLLMVWHNNFGRLYQCRMATRPVTLGRLHQSH